MKRILTALVLIALVFAIVFFGPLWLLAAAAALIAALAAHEFRALAHASGPAKETTAHIPLWWLLGSIALLFFFTLRLPDFELPVLTLVTFLLFTWSGFRAPLSRVLPDTAFGLFALVYVVYPLTLIPLIKSHRDATDGDGTGVLVFLFVCVWFGDIAALYIGKNFGRRKLAPRLSPNKTIEGSVASIAGSVAFGMGVYYLGEFLATRGISLLKIAAPAWQMGILAIILNLAAQLGDLLESAIKRGAGVKDSGTLLPGHGGILDRIDALLLAAPVLWYVLSLNEWAGLLR